MKKYSLISIDLAKTVFQLCAFSDFNKITFNQRIHRGKLLDRLRTMEPTTFVMEACYSSNYWGREIEKLGHTVKLIPPFKVKPFLIGNKNDANDAIAIGEASLRSKSRFVSVKTIAQRIRLDRDSSAARSHELNRLLYKPGFLVMSFVDYFLRFFAFLSTMRVSAMRGV